MVKVKSKRKTIKVSSWRHRRFAVPLHWLGKWVAVNSNHYGLNEIHIAPDEYVITHRKTCYAIGPVWGDIPLHRVIAKAKKLDALGAAYWNFTRPRATKSKRWQEKYKPTVCKILGMELPNESKS